MKMKISVILGVLHMALGIFLRGANHVHFSRKVDFIFEFVPQIVILLAIFGYMDAMIISKWTTDFSGRTDRAPSIIQTMIALFINLGALPKGQDAVIGGSARTQQTISLTLVILAVVCIPTLLCCKPLFYLCSSHE